MVNIETVQKVADNARIKLDEEEAEEFREDFENILEKFSSLDEVNTEDVEPSFHPVEVDSKTRDDEVEETLDREQVFQNTENNEGNYFKGPSA